MVTPQYSLNTKQVKVTGYYKIYTIHQQTARFTTVWQRQDVLTLQVMNPPAAIFISDVEYTVNIHALIRFNTWVAQLNV